MGGAPFALGLPAEMLAGQSAAAEGFRAVKLAPFEPFVWEDAADPAMRAAYAQGLDRIAAVRDAVGRVREVTDHPVLTQVARRIPMGPISTRVLRYSGFMLPLAKGDAIFFNPALFHAAGTNHTTDVRRMANLLQVSSAYGRAMETVDRTRMTKALYPTLCAAQQDGSLTPDQIANTIAANGKNSPGRYAWWIGDEGVKARLDLPPATRSVPNGAALRLATVADWLWRGLRLRGEPPLTRFGVGVFGFFLGGQLLPIRCR